MRFSRFRAEHPVCSFQMSGAQTAGTNLQKTVRSLSTEAGQKVSFPVAFCLKETNLSTKTVGSVAFSGTGPQSADLLPFFTRCTTLRIPARPTQPRAIVRGRLDAQLPNIDIKRNTIAVTASTPMTVAKMIVDAVVLFDVVFFILSFSFSVCHGPMIARRRNGLKDTDCLKSPVLRDGTCLVP